MRTALLEIVTIVAITALCAAPTSAASFTEIPGSTYVFGLSGDGSTAVGRDNAGRAFRWSLADGLFSIPGGSAWGASYDGNMVGGDFGLWTEATGVVSIGTGVVFDISNDALFAVGNNGRYSVATGLWESPPLSASTVGVSGDGSVVVGPAWPWPGHDPYVWTETTGTTLIESRRAGSESMAVSAYGTTVVGTLIQPGGHQAFRWTETEGLVELGVFSNGQRTIAWDTCADGSIVVGGEPWDRRAFIWDAAHGLRDLRDVLIGDDGLDLSGWSLGTVRGISDNGRYLAGTGTNPSGALQGWIVDRGYVPEPTSGILIGLGALVLGALARRRGRGEVPRG